MNALMERMKPVPDTRNPPSGSSRNPPSTPAERALAEAAARRAERDRAESDRPIEKQGRGGPDPVCYGDWEVKGVASDF
jgi:hypothetical protein